MKSFSKLILLIFLSSPAWAQSTQKPVIHAKNWIAITGKPLAATAGATIFQQGGNPVDAACAMLAATCTMWDVLSWGGETQALIYHPKLKKVIAINALGVAPTGATVDFFKSKNMSYPPEYGPLSAVTPGTPGGLMVMLAEYGTMSLKQVLTPALQLANGYPIEAQTADAMERHKKRIGEWPYSKAVMLPHQNKSRNAPEAGELFVQKELAITLQKLIEAESKALAAGKSRKEAIMAANARFYKGDIAAEFVRGSKEQGGLITMEDLSNWSVIIEEPVMSTYKDIEVYKLNAWTQGPALLQSLNILEHFDVKSMGYNSAKYIHTLYQAMNYAYADRDFYYGDTHTHPEIPIKGLLSKEYAKSMAGKINPNVNDENVKPGDPYPFENRKNPFSHRIKPEKPDTGMPDRTFRETFNGGTTTIEAADTSGWIVSITPSGGWIPACIAGNTGIGMSQRMQSFVLDSLESPFNVVAPGKRPRVTLTPSLAFRDGKPFLAFGVQGGDTQDQNLMQFFLNMVEFGMTVQEAAEASNFNSYQMKTSFGKHESKPGYISLNEDTPDWIRKELKNMGYKLEFFKRTSGPINAIYFDTVHGTMWGGSSNYGEDYGIGW